MRWDQVDFDLALWTIPRTKNGESQTLTLTALVLQMLKGRESSYMAMGNQSLTIIGKALGHKSATATQIYSRLTNDSVRQALERAQEDMLKAAKLNQEADQRVGIQPAADCTNLTNMLI